MKNHLSTLPSIGAGARFSPLGMLESLLWSTRSGEFSLVTLALVEYVSTAKVNLLIFHGNLQADIAAGALAGDELLPSVGALTDDLSGIPRTQSLVL